jgi:hypothetical protein
MKLINEAATKVLDPARLFRIQGQIRWPVFEDRAPGVALYTLQPWRPVTLLVDLLVPVMEDNKLLGFAYLEPVEQPGPRDFVTVFATIDYRTALRLDIQMDRPLYFHVVWNDIRRTPGTAALDEVWIRQFPDYEGQTPVTESFGDL